MSTEDPFAQTAKAKSVSWEGLPIGAEIEMILDGPASKVQARKYDDPNVLDTWPDGNPKWNAVLSGTVNGERRSLWVQIPSAMFAAIGAAQSDAGERMGAGGKLRIKLTERRPNTKNPRFKPSNQFAAVYTPPVTEATEAPKDPWAEDEPPF